MDILVYDGSFAGLLSAIFAVYEYRLNDPLIQSQDRISGSLFGEVRTITTDELKAKRVCAGIEKYLGKEGVSRLFAASLSELKGMENTILRFVQYLLQSRKNIERDYGHPDVLTISETVRKVRREKHRMEAFVRFQLTQDGLYYAIVQPDFDVLPLIIAHFEKRYADQRWLIYDAIRKYGIYYDLDSVQTVSMDFNADLQHGQSIASIHDEKEELYQKLWQQYFSSVNIAARKNMKLHMRHMPKRYWKYLPEKRPDMY